MDGPPLYAIGIGATLQVALAVACALWPRRLGAADFYRLSAIIQFTVTGTFAGAGLWLWALMPASLAVAFATLAYTAPARRARAQHLAHLIHADRTDPR